MSKPTATQERPAIEYANITVPKSIRDRVEAAKPPEAKLGAFCAILIGEALEARTPSLSPKTPRQPKS